MAVHIQYPPLAKSVLPAVCPYQPAWPLSRRTEAIRHLGYDADLSKQRRPRRQTWSRFALNL